MRSITKQFTAALIAVAATLALMLAGSGTALAPYVVKSYGGLGPATGSTGVGYYWTDNRERILIGNTWVVIVRAPVNQQLFLSIPIGTPCYGMTEHVVEGTTTSKVISAGAGGRKICR